MYSAGDCIFITTNLYEDGTPKAHLFVVIMEAKEKEDKTILLPFCKINPRRYYDKTVTFKSGEHDFIKEPTYVDYSSGRIETAATLDEMIRLRRARIRMPKLEEGLYQRVCQGIQKSKDTPFLISSYYEDYLFKQLKSK